MLEVLQHIFILAWVKFTFLLSFEHLQVKEQVLELVIKWNSVNVNCKQNFYGFKAFREFAHSSVVNRISFHFDILLAQNCPVSLN